MSKTETMFVATFKTKKLFRNTEACEIVTYDEDKTLGDFHDWLSECLHKLKNKHNCKFIIVNTNFIKNEIK